jgi:hypothetical protein
MGRNKENRKKIEGMVRQIMRHEEKIVRESGRSNPDQGLIKHWQIEIRAWKRRVARLERRLPGRK